MDDVRLEIAAEFGIGADIANSFHDFIKSKYKTPPPFDSVSPYIRNSHILFLAKEFGHLNLPPNEIEITKKIKDEFTTLLSGILLINDTKWNRLILDEPQEILYRDSKLPINFGITSWSQLMKQTPVDHDDDIPLQKQLTNFSNRAYYILLNVDCLFTWVVSGTPFTTFKEVERLGELMRFRCSLPRSELHEKWMIFASMFRECGLFRDYNHIKNQKEMTKIEQKIHWVELSADERRIYDTANSDEGKWIISSAAILLAGSVGDDLPIWKRKQLQQHYNSSIMTTINNLEKKVNVITISELQEKILYRKRVEVVNAKMDIEKLKKRLKNLLPTTPAKDASLGNILHSIYRCRSLITTSNSLRRQLLRQIKRYEFLKSKLELMETDSNVTANRSCSVCLENEADLNDCVLTQCGHFFCSPCLARWQNSSLENSEKCPVCRVKMEYVGHIQKIDSEEESEFNRLRETVGSKMAHLLQYINKIPKNSKVIIYSQFHDLLRLAEKTLNKHNYSASFCKGTSEQIRKITNMFCNDICDPESKNTTPKVILMSTRHNAAGTDLHNGDYIILYEPVRGATREATLQIEKQIIHRAHRISSQKSLKVVRMVVRNTIEEETFIRTHGQGVEE